MVRIAVILFVGSLLVMYLTWRFGIRRMLAMHGLQVHAGKGTSPFRFIMIRDAMTLLCHARRHRLWPFSLKLFLVAALVATACLVVPIGRLIVSNQSFFTGSNPAP